MADEAAIFEAVRRGILSPEEAKNLLPSMPAEVPPEPSLGERLGAQAGEGARAVSTGILKGLSGIAGFPGDMLNFASRAVQAVGGGQPPITLPGGEDIRNFVSNVTGREMRGAETPAGKYIQSGAEGAASMINPVGPTGKGALALGSLVGIGGEAGEHFLGGPLGRLGGGAVPLLLSSYFAFKKPALVKTAQEYLQEVGTKGLDEAAAAKKWVEDMGFPAVLSQGTERATPLSGFVNFLKTVPEGAPIRAALEAGGKKAESVLAEIRDAISGMRPSMETATKVAESGQQVFKNADRMVSQQTELPYLLAKQEQVDPLAAAAAIEQARKAQGYPTTSKAGGAMVSNAADLGALGGVTPAKVSPILGPTGQPIVTAPAQQKLIPATEAAVFKKEAQQAANLAARKEADAVTIMQKRGQAASAEAIKDAIAPPGSRMEAADALHASLRQQYVEPLKKGAFGQLFEDLKPSSVFSNAGEVLSNPNKYSPADIKHIAENLRTVDPEAFPLLYKQHVMTTMEKTMGEQGGRVKPGSFGDAVEKLAGSPDPKSPLYPQREAFRESMKQIALSKGANPSEFITGAEKYMDAMRIVAREQGGAITGAGMAEAGSSAVTHLAKSASYTAPFRGLGWAIERVTRRNLFQKLTDALTSENGAQMLKDIANKSMTKERVLAVVRASIAEDVQYQEAAPKTP